LTDKRKRNFKVHPRTGHEKPGESIL